MTMRNRLAAGLVVLGVALGGACSSEDSAAQASGSGASSGSASGDSGGAGGAHGVGGGTGPGGGCVPGGTQCTDCIDNDGDGWIDSFDVECVGPLDDDEGSFATGIPGDNVDPCKQDCFFDGNSGQGDDKCLWDLACDPKNPGAPECPYDPDKMNCPEKQADQCIELCAKLTPNGCDCFGCCEIPAGDGTTVTVSIGSSGCDEEHATDPTVCKPCTQSLDCFNPCDPCEYCLGKTTLPPECNPGTGGAGGVGGGGTNGCPPEEQACDISAPCPANYYCLTGCCIQIPS